MIYKGSIVKGSGGGSGDAVWGAITGTLSDQTDLANALADKQNVIDSTHKLSASLVDGLATVATTGAYSDLSGKPTIPTVNDATITITQGGVTKGSFTLNQASSDTIALEAGGSVSFDGSTINENANNELQAIGVVDKNSGSALGFWHGTQAQYNAGGEIKDTYYDWETYPHNTSTLPENQEWFSIAYGNGKFVTTSRSTTTAAYSVDGQTWASSTLPASNSWSVGYGNNRFVALSGYKTAYSDDGGETWIEGNNLPSSAWFAGWHIIYADGKFVAVTEQDTNKAVYSTDGITWYDTTLPNTGERYSIIYANNKFVTVCINSNVLNMSTDGQTWSSVTLPISKYWKGIAYGNNTFVILADSDSTTLYSTDGGETWNQGSQGNNPVTQVIFANDRFVALSGYGTYMKYSKNGINWSGAINLLDSAYHTIPVYNNGLFITVNTYTNVSENFSINSVYTLDENPTTASTVYSAPETTSTLTITSVGTGTITLSDTNTYTYNAGGNAYSYYSVGESYPNYVCNIDNVGLKIGDNDIANIAPDGTLINYGTKINAIGIGVSTDTIKGHAQATGARAIAIGGLSEASSMNSIAIGNQAKATTEGAIQLGSWGTASERGLFVGLSAYSNYKLLASNGKIPNDRIDGVSGSFTSQDGKTVTVTNGVITSIV